MVHMGDFNVDLLNYDSHKETQEYYDILSSNGFRPLIFQPLVGWKIRGLKPFEDKIS